MASTDVAAVPRARSRSRLLPFLEREGLAVGVVVLYAASVAFRLPWRIAQDAWLAVVDGRQIVHHGVPGADTLTYWTVGRHWIDQQWIGQAISYAIYSSGGMKLLALSHALLVTLALGLAVYAARRRDASPRAIAWVSLTSIYLLALAAGHVRTQSFAYPLFSLVLLLLLDDVRRPAKRVLLVLPLLVLWGNVHGSVVLGATLVALYGALLVLQRSRAGSARARGGVLIAGSMLALIATPWTLDTLDYYRATLFNSAFRNVVSEWRAPTLSLALLPLFLLAGSGLWLLGRSRRSFGSFHALALLLLIALAFAAQRNIAWFALAAVPLLAPALDEVLPQPTRPLRARANVAFALATGLFACFALLSAATRPEGSYLRLFPDRGGAAVARAAWLNPNAHIYANEQYADWLLTVHPELEGRIAYDIRFELLSQAQLTAVARWRNEVGQHWASAADGARLIVLALPSEATIQRDLLARSGTKVLYRDSRISVLLRPRTNA
jgi:hypothetical protein